MYLAVDLFCLKTFTIVVLKREGASVVISARGIVIVEVVMQAFIYFPLSNIETKYSLHYYLTIHLFIL